ncbi:MAG: AraC family transcriptional regulator [Thermodesulfobacteriota bacterium]
MDTLSEILTTINLSGTVYKRVNLSSPWGIEFDSGIYARFHMVVSGQSWLNIKDTNEQIHMSAGDIVVFPRGDAHSLYDNPRSKLVTAYEVLEAINNNRPMFAGDKVDTVFVGGHFEFDRNLNHPLIDALPRFIHITDSERTELSWLETATNVIIHETASSIPGSDVIVNRLAEVLFIQVLRAYMLRNNFSNGFLAALKNREINKALELIHTAPYDPWTVEKLGREVGMSRSAFSSRFKELVGLAPIEYTTNWRMQKAYEMLKDTQLPLSIIAKQIGYISEPAFSRAFKRQFKQNPGAMRRSFSTN